MLTLNRKKIPTDPGVYFFKKGNKILYVGKASNLKNRLSQYFQKNANLEPAKQRLIKEAARVIWETTDTDIEALLKEAHYIKKYQPPYNVLLRDDKTFISVKITDEEYPRVLTTRKIEKGGAYFGPFTDARAVKETLRILRRLFPYRTTCVPNSGRLCLAAHLGICPGVCAGKISREDYNKNIRHIKDFFTGKKKKIIRDLKTELKQLNQHSDILETVRMSAKERLEYQIANLEKVLKMQKVLAFSDKIEGDIAELTKALNLKNPPHRIEGYDVSNILGTLATASMVVFADGAADKSEYKKFKIKTVRGANDFASIQEVLRRRFAHDDWISPDLVIIDGGRPQLSAALEVWREFNLKIPLVSLAKRHEEIFTPKSPNPIVLPRDSGALHLLQRVRDEAHRFAVSYHKLLRRKKLLAD